MYSKAVDTQIMQTMLPANSPAEQLSSRSTARGSSDVMMTMPQLPIFHRREANDVEWIVSCGYYSDARGTGHSTTETVDLFGQEMQNDLDGIKVGRDTYHHDAEHPSHVTLTVVSP